VEKILTKEEIADLLSAVRQGDVDVEALGSDAPLATAKPPAQHCNLFRSSSIDSWRLKNYDLILDSFARNYGMSLATRFQRAVHIKLEALESMTFDSLLQRLSGHVAIGVLQLEPLTAGGLLVFDEELSFSLIEMILGGNSESQALVPERALSAIERNILRDVINSACPELDKSFEQVLQIRAELVKVVSNLRLLNFVDPEVGVATARFRVTIDTFEGQISLVIPHSALDPLQRQQQFKTVPTRSLQSSRWQKQVLDEMRHMEVEIEVHLATLALRVRDILNFQVGDVIDLGCKPDTPLQVLVEQRPKFLGQVGVQKGKKAIRIMGQIPDGGNK
jgi:flagellar motor switch protein FliM